MRSSLTMQPYSHTTPVINLSATQWTSCSRMPSPAAQVQYYSMQKIVPHQQNIQQSHGLRNDQSSSQPVSSSAHLQARQMTFSNALSDISLRHSSQTTATLPNGQFAQLPASQHWTLTQNTNHHFYSIQDDRDIVPQQNYNMVPLNNVSGTTVSLSSSDHSNANNVVEQNNLRHQSVSPQYEYFNGHNHRLNNQQSAVQPQQTNQVYQVLSNQAPQNNHNNQGQIREGIENGVLYNSYKHYHATSQRHVTPSQPSNYNQQTGQSHSSYMANQVQYSSQTHHQTPLNRQENNSASYTLVKHSENNPPSYTPNTVHHFVNPNQMINQSAELGLPHVQPQIQQQHCRTKQATVPAIQRNNQPQDLQLNNPVTGLNRSSQVISSNKPTRTSPPSYSETNLNYTKVNVQSMQEKHGTHMPSKKHRTRAQQKPSHIPSKAGYSKTSESARFSAYPILHSKNIQRVTDYQTPVQRTEILKENDVLCNQVTASDVPSFEGILTRGIQTDSTTERKVGCEHNRHGEVQYIEDINENLEFLIAQQKALQQSRKAVAVVPPISQQVPGPEKKDCGTTSSDDSLPFKIDAVWSLDKDAKNVDQDSNAQNQPKEITEELLQVYSVPQESNKHEDESTVKSLIADTPTSSNTSQGPVCSTVSASEAPEERNKTDESNRNIVDLSEVEELKFTVVNFKNWVKISENQLESNIKEPVANLVKHLLDLFWDGNAQNLIKYLRDFPAYYSSFFSQISRKDMHTAVFQYLHPKDLMKLEHGYHILKHDTNIPTEEFRSSWLNVDGQTADIENILAEPILDLNLTDYALLVGHNTLNAYSESEPSTKVSDAETHCQKDKEITKELANSQLCDSKSIDKIDTQEPTKKHEDENLQHQQPNQNLNPEESEDANETADTLSKNSRAEREQVCGDARKELVTSKTYSEFVEQSDLINEADSSNDPKLTELSLLLSDDTRTISKEQSGCDWQKEPSQLCQDETTVLVISDSESNDFCNSGKQIKFTCHHVADIKWDVENFCPRCWEEAPLLDLEEALHSPEESSPNMSPAQQSQYDQSCNPHSGNPDSNCPALSESSDIAGSPTSMDDVSEVTFSEPEFNPGDTVESPAPNIEKPVIPAQTRIPADEVSPLKDRPHKKLKLSKRKKKTVDDLFTADEKANSKNTHPSDLTVTLAEDDQKCSDERKETEEERKFQSTPIKQKIQLNASEPDKQDLNVNICSESSSDSSNPSACRVNMSLEDPDTDQGDSKPSSNLPIKDSELSANSPDKEAHGRVPSEGVDVTVPNVAQVCEAQSLPQKIEKRKTDILSPTTASKQKISSPKYPPYKKVKVYRTISEPTEDDLFTPDIIVKKASSPNSAPSDLNVDLKPQVLNDMFQLKRPTVAPNSNANKKKILGKAQPTGQREGKKKMKFALYGFNNGNGRMVQQQFFNRTKSSTAPVYITVSCTNEASQSYTDDALSAKQKVYSQWSSTFVETKKSTSSRKQRQNGVKGELDSMMKALKRHRKERSVIREKQFTGGLKRKKIVKKC
ncbi:uncharacterized protein LOC113645785 isoform X2 [Tachysurus fulvidraco]|nr:uncharacterized protein LOC113645785 isoform X2 [Tachysurus fulvidraco]XP_027007437.2 uncharacterized protein LOC113645785 isoform X2 [Tachysurus fulvidraco]